MNHVCIEKETIITYKHCSRFTSNYSEKQLHDYHWKTGFDLSVYVHPSICLSVRPSLCSVCLPACLSVSVCPSIALSGCLPVCLSACLPACLSACLSVSVCLSVLACIIAMVAGTRTAWQGELISGALLSNWMVMLPGFCTPRRNEWLCSSQQRKEDPPPWTGNMEEWARKGSATVHSPQYTSGCCLRCLTCPLMLNVSQI